MEISSAPALRASGSQESSLKTYSSVSFSPRYALEKRFIQRLLLVKIKNGGQALSLHGKSKETVDQWDGHASQPMMA